MEKGENKGARSYKGQIIGYNMSFHINIKWLIQILVLVGMLVYGWYQLEIRIRDLERNMAVALEEIELHEKERQVSEERHMAEIQEQLLWYESELNLNPFSWGKKSKRK